jgi:NAD(P)-dependent dehydrogenase (short-subunit alcohol dehydrogenase family)
MTSGFSGCSGKQAEGTALVSGASSGIGRATVIALAAKGWRVYAGVRDVSTAPVSDGPGQIVPIELDVTDQASILAATDVVAGDLDGRQLSAVVNNAGVGRMVPMQVVSVADLRAVYEVNVVGAVALSQAALPLMGEGSRLLFLGSIGDRLTMPFGGPLTSSKWAVASITEAFRLELRVRGIDVVLIEPGSIHTPAVDKVAAAASHTATTVAEGDPELARRFSTATNVAIANERRGSPPETAASTIVRALTTGHPRTRYLTGRHARLLATLSAVLPDRTFDYMRLRLFHQPTARGLR